MVAILAVLGLVALVVAVQPVFAWEGGFAPGYWRGEHHWDSWPMWPTPDGQIGPDDTIYEVCNDPALE